MAFDQAVRREETVTFDQEMLHGAGPRLLGIALVAAGVMNLWRGDFTPIFHPMPDSLPARTLSAALSSTVLLGAGIALASGRMWHVGAGLLAAVLVFLSLGWMVRVAMFPAMIGTWLGLAEQLALATGAVAVFAQSRTAPAFLPSACRIVFGLCQIVFALAHFLALPETIGMTPSYLPPGPRFWALATGGLHLAGGVLLLSAIRTVLVTRCLAAMFAVFGLMVWLPMLIERPTAANLAGNLINLALIGAVLSVGEAEAPTGRRRLPA
jgi:uncharacterized membrane protein YphA (DoxX/SURF4 family)